LESVRLVVPIAFVVAAAALAPAASAHARLVSTRPSDGAVVASAPREVRVTFDDAVRPTTGAEVVRNGDGSVLAGEERSTRADRRTLVLPLRTGLPNGDYSVRWRAVSDDGHVEAGVLAFRVGAAGGARPESVLRAEGRPSALDVLSRILYIGGILVAAGTAFFGLVVARDRSLAAQKTLVLALVAVFLGGSALLHASGAATASRFGRVTEVAVLVAAIGATAAGVSTVYPRLLVAAQGTALALLLAPTLGGHALDRGTARALEVPTDLVHVAAAAVWIGGLLQLAFLLPRAGAAARRFSAFALPAVVAIALTGIIRALGELSAVSQLWSTGYGRTILAKSVLFVVLLGLGRRSRRRLGALERLRSSVVTELAVVAMVVVAVGVLTALQPGRTLSPARAAAPSSHVGGAPPAPPPGAVVFAREAGELAVAIAVSPARSATVEADVLAASGGGLNGLDVSFAAGRESVRAAPCGSGCYRAIGVLPTELGRVDVRIDGAGRQRVVRFVLPRRWPPAHADAFMRRATQAFRASSSVVYVERLASSPTAHIVTRWTLVRPNRFAYTIRRGAAGIVIGARRWDRTTPRSRWTSSATTPLPQPEPIWASPVRNAYVLSTTSPQVVVSWANPSIPAWFTARFDRRTARPLELRMTAAAHFMFHRYVSYDRPVRITPPR
jgi:copper transport protein